MSEVSEAIQAKCLAFSDRIIKLNDYLLKEAANAKQTYKIVNGKRVYDKPVPVYLQSVSNLCNCEELVKILVSRCKKLDQQIGEGK